MNKATIRNTPRADALNQLPQRNLYKNGFLCVCALQGTKLCKQKETVTNWFCLFFAFIYAFQNTLYPLYASYKSNLLVTS